MKKRWFLDMCFIIYYASNSGFYLEEKVRKITVNKKEEYIVCCYIIEENIPKWIKEKKNLINEAKQTAFHEKSIPNMEDARSFLFKKHILQLKKILKAYAFSKNKKDFFVKKKRSIIVLERKIRDFIEKFVDEKVIPTDKIDQELRNSLFTYLEGNMSDAKTLASGIQAHNDNNNNNNKEAIMITADKHHWTENNLEWAVPEGSKLKKQYPKLPEIKYLQEI